MAKAPRSLEQFISAVNISWTNFENIDYHIQAQPWLKRFHDYLETRNLEDHISSLKFVLLVSHLDTLNKKLKSTKKLRLRQKYQEDSSKLLQLIKYQFFNIEEDVIAMSNSKLQEACIDLDDQIFTQDKLDLLKKAKQDATIWNEGLEPHYSQFLSHAASSSFIACLLSIL